MEKENYDLVLLVVMTHGDDGGTLYDKYSQTYNECEGNLTPSRVSIIPNVHDVLVAYATIEEYFSWRNKYEGAYFITSFVNAVAENEKNGKVELTGVFKSTARLLAKECDVHLGENRYKQTSTFVSSFTKKYFLVKPSALPNNGGNDADN
ncbi:hypothetical protein B566_EDAN018813 [Ephemera danica]|nr:hypothetical protein B566_EDAN018813 [Ephemera danica]